MHKLRKLRERVFAITDDNVAWVLDEVCYTTIQSFVPFMFELGRALHPSQPQIPWSDLWNPASRY